MAASVFRCHPGSDELLGPHFDVKLLLVIELVFQPVLAKRAKKTIDPRHRYPQAKRSTFATARVSWFQFSSSLASCLRPTAVSR